MKKVQPKVKKIVNRSIEEAKLYADVEIKLEHIMIALINDYDNQAIKILEELKVNVDELHRRVEIDLINDDDSGEINSTLLPMILSRTLVSLMNLGLEHGLLTDSDSPSYPVYFKVITDEYAPSLRMFCGLASVGSKKLDESY